MSSSSEPEKPATRSLADGASPEAGQAPPATDAVDLEAAAQAHPSTLAPSGSLRRHFVSGGMWVSLGMALSGVATLASHAMLARLLEPAELGAYFVLVSLVVIASTVAQLGMDRGAVRMIAAAVAQGRDPRARAAMRAAIMLGILGSAVVGLLIVLGAGHGASRLLPTVDVQPLILAVVVWVGAFTLKELVAESFRALHRVDLATLFSGLATTCICLVAFWTFWFGGIGAGLHEIVWVVAAVTSGVAMWGFAQLAFTARLNAPSDRGVARELLAVSLPLLISGLAILLKRELHLWLLAGLDSEEVTAIFGAVFRLVTLVSTPLLLVKRIVMPSIVAMHATGERERLQDLLSVTGAAAALPALIVLAVFLLFGRELLALVYGDYYAQRGFVALLIVSLGLLINVMTGVAGLLLMMSGNEREVMWITLLTGAVSVGLTYLLVRLGFGVNGAAVGFAVGLAAADAVMCIMTWRKLGLRTLIQPRSAVRAIRLVKRELRARLARA